MSFTPGNLVLKWRGIDDLNIYQSIAFGVGQRLAQPTPTTSTRPSLAFLPNQHRALMIWTNGSSDSLFWSIQPDFAGGNAISGTHTSWAACVTPWKGGAIAVWPGAGSDTRIWLSTYGINGNTPVATTASITPPPQTA
jgi:hypothetical protein